MTKRSDEDQYDEAEAQRRFEQAVKGGLKTPPISKEKTREPKPARKSNR